MAAKWIITLTLIASITASEDGGGGCRNDTACGLKTIILGYHQRPPRPAGSLSTSGCDKNSTNVPEDIVVFDPVEVKQCGGTCSRSSGGYSCMPLGTRIRTVDLSSAPKQSGDDNDDDGGVRKPMPLPPPRRRGRSKRSTKQLHPVSR